MKACDCTCILHISVNRVSDNQPGLSTYRNLADSDKVALAAPNTVTIMQQRSINSNGTNANVILNGRCLVKAPETRQAWRMVRGRLPLPQPVDGLRGVSLPQARGPRFPGHGMAVRQTLVAQGRINSRGLIGSRLAAPPIGSQLKLGLGKFIAT